MNKKKSLYPLITKMNDIKNIHFIGIGGSSMGGIAEILLQEGYTITGSDIEPNNITQKLIYLGVKIFFKHSKNNVTNADVVVISSAILFNNPEVLEAKNLNIPIILRAEMVSEIMRYKYGIAISGTHGKTSTTAIIFSIFNDSRLNPMLMNGGYVKSINNNVKTTKNSFYCIVEADESDASFLHLRPIINVVTNIEMDHVEKYNGSLKNLKLAFLKFIHNLPFYGTSVLCIDDEIIRQLIPSIKRKIITYGFSKDADVRIKKYYQKEFISYFIIIRKNKPILKVTLNLPGRYNALNATAAIAIATKENINDNKITKSLKNFKGVQRRFELHGIFKTNCELKNNNTIMIINDYGHHPTEILSSINTARSGWPDKKLLMIFQPHRYTRTKNFKNEFKHVLSNVDELFMLKIYSAHEMPISESDNYALYKEIKKHNKTPVQLILKLNKLFEIIMSKLSGNDLLLIQGAGDINNIVDKFLIKKLKKRTKQNDN